MDGECRGGGQYTVRSYYSLVRAMNKLTFAKMRYANLARLDDIFHPIDEWNACEWACAMAGEAGEVCNAVKKMKRMETGSTTEGDPTNYTDAIDAIGSEIADTILYLDLLAARLSIDIGHEVCKKFNEVSERRKSRITLNAES